LLLICEEYTTKEIAKKLFRAINTIETHRKNMLIKTECKNSVGLALWAVKEGLLPGFECYAVKNGLLPNFKCFAKNV